MTEDFHVWEGIYPSFKECALDSIGPGFNGDVWRQRTLKTAQECIAALKMKKPLPSFYKQRSTLLPVVVAMMLESKDKLKILDFGGGLGIGYMTLIESIPQYSERILYEIIEVPEICEVGRELFLGGGVTYSASLPSKSEFDIVHSASALQYIEDWPKILKLLSGYNPKYILLSDIFAGSIPTFVTLQNYYGSRIRHWFLNFEELFSTISLLDFKIIMNSFAESRRLGVEDRLPMSNFPESHRLRQTLHLLLSRIVL